MESKFELRIYRSTRMVNRRFAKLYPNKTIEVLPKRRNVKRGTIETFAYPGDGRSVFAMARFDECVEVKSMERLLAREWADRHFLRTAEDVASVFPKHVKDG